MGTRGVLSLVAYDRGTGSLLWRSDSAPPGTDPAIGVRVAQTPGGGLVVAGSGAGGGYWWTAAFDSSGRLRWEARRDLASNREEPTDLVVLPDGTAVVTGASGPEIDDGMGNSYLRGVTIGYSSTGTLLWEAFSTLPTRAVIAHQGDVCATGGYDALITCFSVTVSGPTAVIAATPTTGAAPLTVRFDAQGSQAGSAPLMSWAWVLGDGTSTSGVQLTHIYSNPGRYSARLEVADSLGQIGVDVREIVVTAPVPPVDNDRDGVPATEDCDDTNADVHPGATEICDSIDNDCDRVVDGNLSQECCGTGVALCTAGAWGACSVSCAVPGADGGTSGDASGAARVVPPTGCSTGGGRSGSLMAVLGTLLLALLRRRRSRPC